MKKYLLSSTLIFLAIASIAQTEHSDTYNRGYLFGKGLAMLLMTSLVIWGLWRFARKKKQ